MLEETMLTCLLEAILLAAGKPLSIEVILNLFAEEEKPSKTAIHNALTILQKRENSGIELIETASGFQFQVKVEWSKWISRLWEEKPAKYSKAFLETLALIAYRQPITRGEIEAIRGVSINPNIIKTLQDERGWIRIVGYRAVPGKPALYATTKEFLDYFGLQSLNALPSLPEIAKILESAEGVLDETAQIPLNFEAGISTIPSLIESERETETEIETDVEIETSIEETAKVKELKIQVTPELEYADSE